MRRVLRLSIDVFSISLNVFESYERLTAQVGDVEYSLNGSAIETGSLHEPKFIWSIAAYVSNEQWRQLWAMYQRSEKKRRSQQPYYIAVDDFAEPFTEDGNARSRALAPNGTVTNQNGYISYPARFGARMFEPKSQKVDNLLYPYVARFTLKELDRIAP
jgi:hypothetical protein